MASNYVGVSGWSYHSWHESFYPDEVSKKAELSYASRKFNSLEINGSCYSLLSASTYRRWYEETPRRFLFAVKGSRFITHNKKLKDVTIPLANFFASGLLALDEKLGPVLWQLPATASFDEERLEGFLSALPRDTRGAARLARKHDDRVKGRAATKIEGNHRLRHALEVRHESFLDAAAVRVLRRHGVGLVFADSGSWPYVEELTAGFVYLRLHGSPQTYESRYSDRALDRFAERLLAWHSGGEPADPVRITGRRPPRRKSRDVYVYFDNDQRGHAPFDALRLVRKLRAHRDTS